ncbi:MAG: tetratricopeptide repeat protein [Isosphaeraceae bacterium]|nr:tetratricopeptide repeat protein [Isosphaeraceae bacterium]
MPEEPKRIVTRSYWRIPCLRRRGAVVLALMCLAAAAIFGLKTDWLAAKRRDAARRALRAGKYDECARVADDWLRSSPRSPEAHYLRARVALALGRPDQLRECLVRAEELGFPQEKIAVLRAIVAAQLGQYQDAEPILRSAFERNADADPQLDEALARLYLETYDFRHALAVLERWARDSPRDPRPYLWRCEVDQRVESRTTALIGDYKAALDRDPGLPKARLGLAKELRLAHRNAEAQVQYDHYIRLRPSDAEGFLGAGVNALELQDEEAALRFLDKALQLDPKRAEAYRSRAELDLIRGAPEAAITYLDRAASLDPFDETIRYKRAQALARVGRASEARTEQAAGKQLQESRDRLNKVRELLVVNPRDRQLQCEVAQWMFEHGHDDEGCRWCEKILKEEPGHARASSLLAACYERQGKHGLANYYRLNAKELDHRSRSER